MFRQNAIKYSFGVSVEARLLQGLALQQKGLLGQAKAIYEEILRAKPDHADSLHFLGVIEDGSGNHAYAIELIQKSIDLAPHNPSSHLNLGNARRNIKQFQAAIDCYDKAIALKSDYVFAYSNKGTVLESLGAFQDAIACYDMAISINPEYAEAVWNKASVSLLTGDFGLGWKLFEWRWRVKAHGMARRHLEKPLWLGEESLQGKTLLIHDEQGLGDTIQFCRYAKMASELGAHVILEVSLPLLALFRTLEGEYTLIPKGAEPPAYDFQCPIASLPLAFKTRLGNIPSAPSYLQSDPNKVSTWSQRLGPKNLKRVGLVWNGNKDHMNDLNSIPLATLIHYLPKGNQYISLQKEVRDTDLAALKANPQILHFGDDLTDFSDTAALCELLDVVVCVDTSVAHLAGALGKPTWILLPRSPDWRWLLNRRDNPWYPSIRLYRQAVAGAWESVLSQVREDL